MTLSLLQKFTLYTDSLWLIKRIDSRKKFYQRQISNKFTSSFPFWAINFLLRKRMVRPRTLLNWSYYVIYGNDGYKFYLYKFYLACKYKSVSVVLLRTGSDNWAIWDQVPRSFLGSCRLPNWKILLRLLFNTVCVLMKPRQHFASPAS